MQSLPIILDKPIAMSKMFRGNERSDAASGGRGIGPARGRLNR